MSSYYRTISNSYLYVLDIYPNAQFAYSLRKLRSDYVGACIRVRRTSDNAEQDIGFSGNSLDTASLLSFVGAGSGFIVTWYDQSTNVNNAVQTTSTRQCYIVDTGVLVTDPDNGKLATQWNADKYQMTGVLTQQIFFKSWVFNRASASTQKSFSDSSSSRYLFAWSSTNTIVSLLASSGTPADIDSSETQTGAFSLVFLRDSSNVMKCYINGSATEFTPTDSRNATPDEWGANGTGGFTGYQQELIYWHSDLEGDRLDIETIINGYYNIY